MWRFKVYEWKDIIPALEAGEVDMISGGIVITPQRALHISFTRPVAMSGAGMATNTEMTKDIENLQQLNNPDIVIATITDTFSEGVARSIFDKAEIHSHANKDDAEKEILAGRAHAYISSLPAVQFLVSNNSDAIDLPLSEPGRRLGRGVGGAKRRAGVTQLPQRLGNGARGRPLAQCHARVLV